MSKITIYHGSEKIVQNPDIKVGKKHNDYGQGFYCTEDLELAKEWACKNDQDGFANVYELDLNGLKVLRLNSSGYTILNWIAILLNDSYFSFVDAFVSNSLSLRSLNKALRLGKLGEQVVLVSQKAFDNLKYIESISAECKIYYPKFFSRDNNARLTYRNEIAQTENVLDDIFVLDIIRQEMRNDDPRIQQIVSE